MGRISNEEYAKRKAEADAKAAEENGSAGTEPDLTNPREPVDQAREGAEPKTIAAGGLPVGTPGTVEPESAEDLYDRRIVATTRVPMASVKILRTYFPMDGSGKLTAGDEVDLPKEEARSLIESGIASFVDHVNEPVAE